MICCSSNHSTQDCLQRNKLHFYKDIKIITMSPFFCWVTIKRLERKRKNVQHLNLNVNTKQNCYNCYKMLQWMRHSCLCLLLSGVQVTAGDQCDHAPQFATLTRGGSLQTVYRSPQGQIFYHLLLIISVPLVALETFYNFIVTKTTSIIAK